MIRETSDGGGSSSGAASGAGKASGGEAGAGAGGGYGYLGMYFASSAPTFCHCYNLRRLISAFLIGTLFTHLYLYTL